ncbi:MAG: hypothetical protein AMXMBFR33_33840 [Candidatus Xenobia bacterium]|jgi:hypothetical protein
MEEATASDLEGQLGLSAPAMLSIFNRMYLESWAREMKRPQNTDLLKRLSESPSVDPKLFLEMMEVVVTAARDATVLTLYENNEKLVEDLKAAGVKLVVNQTHVD